MTSEQIKLVKQSWKIFRSIDPLVVGDTFYSKLFTDNPFLRKLFPVDMELQYKKLVDMITTIVGRLDNISEVNGEIAAMGQRHVQYGVKPGHYILVGKALLWTLEKGMGKDWNGEIAAAWKECYIILSGIMTNATATAGT